MSKEEKLKVPETVTVHTLSLKPLPFSGSRFVEFQADFSPRKNRYLSIIYLVKAHQYLLFPVITPMENTSLLPSI